MQAVIVGALCYYTQQFGVVRYEQLKNLILRTAIQELELWAVKSEWMQPITEEHLNNVEPDFRTK
jgi:hypothetical protein